MILAPDTKLLTYLLIYIGDRCLLTKYEGRSQSNYDAKDDAIS